MDGDEVGGLVRGGRVDLEGGLAGGFERRLEVEQAAGVVGLVHEQGVARIGALHGEIEAVVGGQRVGGIDAHLALVAAVGHSSERNSTVARPFSGTSTGLGLDRRGR